MESASVVFEANICPKLRFSGTQIIIKPEGEFQAERGLLLPPLRNSKDRYNDR